MKKNLLVLLVIFTLSGALFPAQSSVAEVKTLKDYESLVTKSTTPIVMDFYRDSCGPCQRMKPIIEKLAQDPAYEGKVRFVKLDVENDNVNELVTQYNIRSIPTFIFKKGPESSKHVGFIEEDKLRGRIDELIAD